MWAEKQGLLSMEKGHSQICGHSYTWEENKHNVNEAGK